MPQHLLLPLLQVVVQLLVLSPATEQQLEEGLELLWKLQPKPPSDSLVATGAAATQPPASATRPRQALSSAASAQAVLAGLVDPYLHVLGPTLLHHAQQQCPQQQQQEERCSWQYEHAVDLLEKYSLMLSGLLHQGETAKWPVEHGTLWIIRCWCQQSYPSGRDTSNHGVTLVATACGAAVGPCFSPKPWHGCMTHDRSVLPSLVKAALLMIRDTRYHSSATPL